MAALIRAITAQRMNFAACIKRKQLVGEMRQWLKATNATCETNELHTVALFHHDDCPIASSAK